MRPAWSSRCRNNFLISLRRQQPALNTSVQHHTCYTPTSRHAGSTHHARLRPDAAGLGFVTTPTATTRRLCCVSTTTVPAVLADGFVPLPSRRWPDIAAAVAAVVVLVGEGRRGPGPLSRGTLAAGRCGERRRRRWPGGVNARRRRLFFAVLLLCCGKRRAARAVGAGVTQHQKKRQPRDIRRTTDNAVLLAGRTERV